MAKVEVRVTGSQRAAARALVRRSAVTGRYVSPALLKIANAQARGASDTDKDNGTTKD